MYIGKSVGGESLSSVVTACRV